MVESRDYAVGFDEAIEYAQRVYRRLIRKIGSGTLADIFDGEDSVIRIIEKYSLKDIAKRLEEHIEVGDEVMYGGSKCVVMNIDDDRVQIYTDDHKVYHLYNSATNLLIKTGRHFDEVEILFNKMRDNT